MKQDIKCHETCKCKCGLDASVCNNKQRWNEDKCRCECEELVDKGVCDKGFIWNPSIHECECDKLCDVGQYSDYENCKCRKKLDTQLKIPLAEYENMCKCSCAVYIVLFSVFLTISIGISSFYLSLLVLRK